MSEKPLTASAFAERIIDGPGGWHAFVAGEMVEVHSSPERAAALWTLRCLANPRCEGSAEVLEQIMAARERGGANA